MTENLPEDPGAEAQDADELELEAQDADEIEKELLEAMRDLRRKNKNVEEYLDGLARTTEKPAGEPTQEENDTPTS